ncbi:MAG: amino acid adenylation domain-containing protein [Caldilinea sp. CFX5]|nr:amino acid adenylation domain-containing protein [Caldilinea sp. CFX5]
MSAVELLTEANKCGIRLWLEGEHLRYSAPKGALSAPLRKQLTEQKAELIALLRQTAASPLHAPPLRRVPRNGALPLSFAQQRLWFLNQIAPNNPFYNIAAAIPLEAPLNIAALQQSLNEIIRRHEALRTTFDEVGGTPVQIIAPQVILDLPRIDLRPWPAQQRRAEAIRLATEEARRPFNLAADPLIRTTLMQLDERSYFLLLTIHHIVADGWSMDIFFRELTVLYTAFAQGQSSPLSDLPLQYADYAVWQRNWLSGDVLAHHLDFWRRTLLDLAVLELPIARPRPLVANFQGAYQPFALPKAMIDELTTLSHRHNVTLFMTLLAAYVAVLSRYSGQTDIVVGVPVAGRNHVETEPLIGFFVNTLVLRIDAGDNPTFSALLQRVRSVALAAYAHQEVPFEKLVEELHPTRDLSRNPLCQVTFQLWHAGESLSAAHWRKQDQIEVERGAAIFDLSFRLWEYADGVRGGVEYSTDLFDTAAIARLVGHYLTLLQGALADPDTPLSALPLLTEVERQQVLEQWSGDTIPFAADGCLHHLFEQQVARTPDNLAVVGANQALTYAELNARANGLAHRLQQLGVGPDVCVGICMERSPALVIALFGVLKAGGAYVPIDPDYPLERIALMLHDAETPVVITQTHLRNRLPSLTGAVLCLDAPTAIAAAAEPPPSGVTLAHLAYVIYTSGSTGTPKGVMIPHAAIANHMQWMQAALPLIPADRVLQKTPFSFDASVWEFYAPLSVGATLVMAPAGAHADVQLLVKTIQVERITILQLVPSLLRILLNEQPEQFGQCRTLRRLFCGGEALSADLVKRCHTLLGLEIYNLYGPTEATIDTTCWRCQPDADSATVPIGRPIANVQVYVLDDNQQPTPIGAPGELYIGGVALARGYLHRPQLTAASFLPNPFATVPGARLYKTGDLVRYTPDGVLNFLGRRDQQVKVHGQRVELGEVEAALRKHPAVKEVVAAIRREQDTQTVVAYVLLNTGQQPATAETDDRERRIEHVQQWQEVYNEIIYRDVGAHASAQHDPTRNVVGWNSSYTGKPIPLNEMEEWLAQTVARVLRHRPQRVLEIGCGTGMLLFRIAPHCQRYHATDFSPVVLAHLQSLLATRDLPQVTLAEQAADNFAHIPAGHFDLVLLNSVIQYFPSADYLLDVLAGALNATAPGGHIFIGDVRNLALLNLFYLSVELAAVPASLPVSELARRIQQRLMQEEELVIDPLFFTLLRERFPRLSGVEIQPKQGHFRNELMQYRMDVILHVGCNCTPPPEGDFLDWRDHALDLAAIATYLTDRLPRRLSVTRIPNALVEPEQSLATLLNETDRSLDVATLLDQVTKRPNGAVAPQALGDLCNALPYHLTLSCAPGNGAVLDALFVRHDVMTEPPVWFAAENHRQVSWRQLANSPIQGMFTRRLAPELRKFVQRCLPDYMAPTSILLLDALPYTPSGKIDRQALLTLSNHRAPQALVFAPPRTPVEQKLAEIWQEVLAVAQVGGQDDFFQLGGHSLLAAQVISRIRQTFLIELPLRQIFLTSKLEELALAIEEMLLEDVERLEPVKTAVSTTSGLPT